MNFYCLVPFPYKYVKNKDVLYLKQSKKKKNFTKVSLQKKGKEGFFIRENTYIPEFKVYFTADSPVFCFIFYFVRCKILKFIPNRVFLVFEIKIKKL